MRSISHLAPASIKPGRQPSEFRYVPPVKHLIVATKLPQEIPRYDAGDKQIQLIKVAQTVYFVVCSRWSSAPENRFQRPSESEEQQFLWRRARSLPHLSSLRNSTLCHLLDFNIHSYRRSNPPVALFPLFLSLPFLRSPSQLASPKMFF